MHIHALITARSSRSGAGGFTLMEIMLVVALTGILMYSMSIVFQRAAVIVGVTGAEVETRQKARSIFSRLEMDLGSAFINSKGQYFVTDGSTLKFVTSAKYNPEGLVGRMDVTQVVYTLTSEAGGAEVKALKKYPVADEEQLLVRYALTFLSQEEADKYNIEYSGEQPELKQYDTVSLDDPGLAESTKQYVDIVAGRVTDFKVQCMQAIGAFSSNLELGEIDNYWTYAWNSPISKKLPRAVKIQVSVRDSKDMIERTFESIMTPKFTRGSP